MDFDRKQKQNKKKKTSEYICRFLRAQVKKLKTKVMAQSINP